MLAVVIAAFLLLTNASIPFANGGSCDPWHYFGQYFLAAQPSATLPIRDLARVPEFLIGYLLERAVHGIAVQYLNFLIFFVSAATAIYFAVKRLFGFVPATVALIFFAAQPLVIGNYSLTYTEASVSYSALAIAFAIFSSAEVRGRRIAYVILSGFFWASAIHAHLESLTVNFIVPLYCINWRNASVASQLRDIAEKGVALLAGGLCATAVFGAINVALFHGQFFFFIKQFQAIFTIQIKSYEKPDWYLHSGRGALILLGLVVTAVQGRYVWRRGTVNAETAAILAAIVPFFVMMTAQLVYTFFFDGLSLEYDYWFVWIIAPLAIALGSLISRVSLPMEKAGPLLTVYCAASLVGTLGRGSEGWPFVVAAAVPFAVVLLLLGALGFINSRPAMALCIVLLCLAAIGATVRPEKYGLYAWTGQNQRDTYERVDQGMEYLAGLHLPKVPKFWTIGYGDSWETIAYARSYNYCLFQYLLPELLHAGDENFIADNDNFLPGDYLVLAARNDAQLGIALTKLKQQGRTFERLGSQDISYKQLSYVIVVGVVH